MKPNKSKKILMIVVLILVVFFVWLFGFKVSFLKVDDSNPEQYTLEYRGNTYYGKEYYSWRINDTKSIGYANGLGNRVYKSTGEDNKKFIEVWDSFNVQLRGLGLFYRDDIVLEKPSSKNIGSILYSSDEEVDSIIRDEIIDSFDKYNEDSSCGVNIRGTKTSIKNVCMLSCNHKDYNINLWLVVYLADNEYYVYSENFSKNFLPISKEAGDMIAEAAN